jgi:flagellar biogenesis protein FliO
VAYHPFGPRRGVAALRVGSEVLVLGVTNTDLKLLRVLDASKVEGGAAPATSTGSPG